MIKERGKGKLRGEEEERRRTALRGRWLGKRERSNNKK
jgi:hypothetical protein